MQTYIRTRWPQYFASLPEGGGGSEVKMWQRKFYDMLNHFDRLWAWLTELYKNAAFASHCAYCAFKTDSECVTEADLGFWNGIWGTEACSGVLGQISGRESGERSWWSFTNYTKKIYCERRSKTTLWQLIVKLCYHLSCSFSIVEIHVGHNLHPKLRWLNENQKNMGCIFEITSKQHQRPNSYDCHFLPRKLPTHAFNTASLYWMSPLTSITVFYRTRVYPMHQPKPEFAHL